MVLIKDCLNILTPMSKTFKDDSRNKYAGQRKTRRSMHKMPAYVKSKCKITDSDFDELDIALQRKIK